MENFRHTYTNPRTEGGVIFQLTTATSTEDQLLNYLVPIISRAVSRGNMRLGIIQFNCLVLECSLRTAAGSKLRRLIVKKLYAVPNIYECENLCSQETDFPCASYAYR